MVEPAALERRPPARPEPSSASAGSGATGVWCLVAVARYHGMDLSRERLSHSYALGSAEPATSQIVRMARDAKLTARHVRLSWDDLTRMGQALPAVLRLRDGSYVILSGLRDDRGRVEVVVRNPLTASSGFEFWPRETLDVVWGGDAILVKRRFGLTEAGRPFGLAWFLPEILRLKSAFGQIVMASLVLQLLGLGMPIFFQLLIDKVVLHQVFSTLTALGIGVMIAVTFEAILGYLRTYLLLHATSKIDIRMSTRVFSHLVSLPLEYFERIASGILVNHVQQDRSIREFLTGKVFFTFVDSLSLVVFLPILLFYSMTLSAVVGGFGFLIASVIALAAGVFRRRLQDLYRAEATRQALLVETVHGIGTVKALSLEPVQRRLWDDRSAAVVEKNISVGTLSAAARSLSSFFEKAMLVVVLWIGVELVVSGQLSVGELVAFQMLASRVTGPMLQMVSLIHDYQQAAVSVRMLGEVMNAASEAGDSRGLQPKLRGALAFEGVTFRYPGSQRPALDQIGFSLPPESVLGVVGRSGSGKTTLIRLLQGLYPASAGIIRIDGYDLREIDRTHLRQQLGVVLQESFLFRGTIRENIAVTRQDASFEEIVHVARLAGADEFVQHLPKGYDTVLEEGATNLSGGQRQRLAIARALLRQPSLLILDEATSALDPESEIILQRHMADIVRGRTTVIVSHRLSMIRNADAILVMDGGRMAGLGRHEELLATCPMYRTLWNAQTEAMR